MDAKNKPALRPMVTPKELAALLRIDERQVRRLKAEGKLPPHVMVGSHPRWPADAIDEFMRGGPHPGAA